MKPKVTLSLKEPISNIQVLKMEKESMYKIINIGTFYVIGKTTRHQKNKLYSCPETEHLVEAKINQLK